MYCKAQLPSRGIKMKVCYWVVKNNETIEVDVEKITTIFFAILTIVKSKPDSIVNMAMMREMPPIDIRAVTHSIIQVKYPRLLNIRLYKMKERY